VGVVHIHSNFKACLAKVEWSKVLPIKGGFMSVVGPLLNLLFVEKQAIKKKKAPIKISRLSVVNIYLFNAYFDTTSFLVSVYPSA
jgi:hypothetical protein